MIKRLINRGEITRAKSLRSGKRNREQGSILIACLIILSVLAVYGAVLVSVVYERSIHVQVALERLQALYLAEAGLARAIHEIKALEDSDGDGLGNIPKTNFGSGFFYAVHDPGNLAITAIGEVNQVQRKVRIQYAGV